MTLSELQVCWVERDRRYLRHHRHLSDEERAIIAAYRRSEVARLVTKP